MGSLVWIYSCTPCIDNTVSPVRHNLRSVPVLALRGRKECLPREHQDLLQKYFPPPTTSRPMRHIHHFGTFFAEKRMRSWESHLWSFCGLWQALCNKLSHSPIFRRTVRGNYWLLILGRSLRCCRFATGQFPRVLPWPFPQVGIDFDIFYRIQATTLKYLLHHPDFSNNEGLAENDNLRFAALQHILGLGMPPMQQVESYDSDDQQFYLVKRCAQNLVDCLDRYSYSHRAKYHLQAATGWLASRDPSTRSGSLDENHQFNSIFILAPHKRVGKNSRLICLWLDKCKPSVANYDQLDRRYAKYNYLQTKYINYFVRLHSNVHGKGQLVALLHQIHTNDEPKCGAPLRLIEEWIRTIATAFVDVIDTAHFASQSSEFGHLDQRQDQDLERFGVHVRLPGLSDEEYIKRIRTELKDVYQTHVDLLPYSSHGIGRLVRRLRFHVSLLSWFRLL